MVKGCLVYKFVVIIFIPLQVKLEEFAAYILQCNNIGLMYITLELICRHEWWKFPKIEIFFEKEEAGEQNNIDFDIRRFFLLFLVVYLLKNSFFICYLSAPQQSLGYYQGNNHCYLMLITAFWHYWLAGCQELCNEFG